MTTPKSPKPFPSLYPGVCKTTGNRYAAGAQIQRGPNGWELANAAQIMQDRKAGVTRENALQRQAQHQYRHYREAVSDETARNGYWSGANASRYQTDGTDGEEWSSYDYADAHDYSEWDGREDAGHEEALYGDC